MRTRLESVGAAVDRSWPWLPLGLLAAAVLIFGISYVAGPGPSPAEQVNDTVEEFAIAVANSDGDDACGLATPEARRELRGALEDLSCEQVVRNFGVGVPGPQLRDAPRTEPAISGDRAVVRQPTIGVALVLVRRDGDWLVDELQRFPAREAR